MKLWAAAAMLLSAPAVASEIPAELQVKLQSAMIAHIDNVSVDGAYSYVDTQENALTTVYPANIHPFVIGAGEDYFVCSEMINESGDTVAADFLVREVDGVYRVVQMIVNNRPAVMAAIKKLGE